MADLPTDGPPLEAADDELVAIPRLAEQVGVTARVLRYWEEQGLISPTREHGKLRYSPRDLAIARLTKSLLDAGASVDGLRMLKDVSERDIRRAAEIADPAMLSEVALRVLYQRKAFREATGMKEEHYPHGDPKPPGHGPGAHHGPGPKKHRPKPPGPPRP
ncbi:MAG TPA: helix-turn-helix domain-containing protein [Candidatus Micrarchaeaceae archaeon]|nr:helix-turn-helix domain-containing protein [Candidatus Micrarchaeaceae archaeon]